MASRQLKQVRTACNRDCPDACGLIADVQDGKVVRLQGDPQHPVTQGFLCHRTSRFLDRQYDPQRIVTPLARRGTDFQPISWDEALDQVAEKLQQVRAQSGPTSILYYRSAGSMGLMKHVTDAFFERFGPVTIKSGDVCSGAGDAAQMLDFGDEDGHDLFDLDHSQTVVLWGKNVYVSQVHLLPVLKRAQARGVQFTLIDPVWQQTAQLCNRFIQPCPGGDAAVALGTARILFDQQWYDSEASSYCDHLAEFQALACSRDLDTWAAMADVSVADLQSLAHSYTCHPTATLIGWGLQRRRNGSATVRVIDALASISGNLGVPGGGISYCCKRRGAFDLSFTTGLEQPARAIPEPLLGRGILEAEDPPIRVAWVCGGNPVAMLPESRRIAEGLQSREMTVVVDSFMTDTARCADIILPTTTMLEEDDLLGAYGHHWLVESRPATAPPPGVKSDYEITQELAHRVGLGNDFSAEVDTWKRHMLQRVSNRGASLDDLRRGPVRNPLAQQVMYRDRKFPTPTGRVNLVTDVATEPTPTTRLRPLLLMALSTQYSQASQWVAGHRGGPAVATVHPAAAESFTDGDLAVVESELGRMTVRLQFDPRQRKDVLLVPKGGWLADGCCANALVPGEVTDDGGCAVFYDTPVRLLLPTPADPPTG
ncbi:MAG: molybdopterin-containing oxidoreductase catalytic subunit [Planctomycetaceae bacterium]|nr:molybdopterin-containing oxidoreductase catalytic subunit [Planctomycetaceae bacterium]